MRPLGLNPPAIRALAAALGLLVLALATDSDAAPQRPRPRKARRTAERSQTAGEAMRLLHAECLSCHGEEKPKSGLVLLSREAALRGGDEGTVLVPGDPASSRVWSVLAANADPHMPPKRQLATNQVDLVRRWIAAGAPWDDALLARLRGPREVPLEPLPAGYRPVEALALSPDGQRLALGRGDHLVVHDLAATNRPALFDRPVHPDVVRAVAWSPDGRRLATGAFRELVVRDAATFEPVWSLATNLLGRVTALRFSPHGGALIAADAPSAGPGWVRVFEADTGLALAAWPAHDDTIYDLAVSPDGGLLATAGGDRLVKLWELLTRHEVARLEGHMGAVFGIAFNPAATELVSVGADKQLKLWDVRTREAVVTMGGRKHGLNAVAWSADGSRVVAVDDEGVVQSFSDFKRHTGEQSSATAKERQLGRRPGPLHAVALNAEGKEVYAGGEDGVVHGLTGEGKALATLPLDPAAPTAGPATPANAPGPLDPAPPPPETPPSFVSDVLPVLAKAGCSAGSCHAKADGQNGFKLSVFSYDPESDHAEIVKEGRGRRVFPASPDESLLLLKPLGVVHHGGGRRIEPGSDAQLLLRRWIRAGMPYRRTNEPALVRIEVAPREGTYGRGAGRQLRVAAHYADGSTRDVTRLAEFASNDGDVVQVDGEGLLRTGTVGGEGVVIARYLGFVDASRVTVPAERLLPPERYAAWPVNNFIDEHALAQFRRLGLFPSETCSDAEFLRRATLDTIGVLPTPAEARAFLGEDRATEAAARDDSPAPGAEGARARASAERRSAWIDQLLARPEFGDYWAGKWADLLRPNSDRVGVKSVYVLDQWLREAFRANKPYDQLVREVVLAEGSNHRDGPVVVYRDRREPPELTTLVSQVFLGVRLECAKCHHHPNEKWSQDDFYQFAAVFGALQRKGAGLSPPISAGTETFYHAPGGAVKHPVSGAEMKPRPPDGPLLDEAGGADPRRGFADWLTHPSNPFFARAAVNRVWAAFFGRGFVEPVDDFRISNPPVQEPLLDALAADFARHGYDLKHLMRTILNSRLYQLSSTPNEHNLTDTRNFSRSYRRRLPAEVLLDAVNDLTGVGDDFNGCPPGTRAAQTWSYKVRSQFLDAFGRPNPSSDCPCERDLRTSVVQSLHLMNSRRLHEKLANAEGRARRLAGSDLGPEGIVTELYLAALSRFPTAEELRTATAAFGGEPATRPAATEDVLWALLNSAEFVFNH